MSEHLARVVLSLPASLVTAARIVVHDSYPQGGCPVDATGTEALAIAVALGTLIQEHELLTAEAARRREDAFRQAEECIELGAQLADALDGGPEAAR